MKNRIIARVVVLALCLFVSGPPAGAQDVLETMGTLISFKRAPGGWEITLLIHREQASAPVAPDCRYFVNDIEVSQRVFIERSVGEQVTVEFQNNRLDVSLCRVHVAL
jgi:hypothetical protein